MFYVTYLVLVIVICLVVFLVCLFLFFKLLTAKTCVFIAHQRFTINNFSTISYYVLTGRFSRFSFVGFYE